MVNVNSDPDKSERVTAADFLPAPALAPRKSSAEEFAETGWDKFLSGMIGAAGSVEGYEDSEGEPEPWGDESDSTDYDDGPIDLGT